MPDLCGVMFLVDKDKVPIYGVKAIMATRSRHLYQIILAKQKALWGASNSAKGKLALLSKLKQLRKKKSSSSLEQQASTGLLTVHLADGKPDTFREVIQFVHSGRISVGVHNVVDVMVTAHRYGPTDLCASCFHFATSFINLDTILPLLTTTLESLENKWIRLLLTKIWDFVEENAGLIFQLPDFEKLSKKPLISIISRPKLRVAKAEVSKVVSHWCRTHARVTDKDTRDSLLEELLAVVACSQHGHVGVTEDLESVDRDAPREANESLVEMGACQSDLSCVSHMSLDSVGSHKFHLQPTDQNECQKSLSTDSGVTLSFKDCSL